jgi:hypothetical protein
VRADYDPLATSKAATEQKDLIVNFDDLCHG